MAVLLGFWYLAILNALRNSTIAFDPAGRPLAAVGFANFGSVLTDAAFRHSLALTAVFTAVEVPLQIGLGLFAAVLLRRQTQVNAVVRSVIFLPTVIPIVVISLIFAFLFDQQVGFVNAALATIGAGERIAWLYEERGAQLILLLLSIWQDVGLTMLIFLAGLQAIPASVSEAARLDGADPWQELWQITIPLLRRSFQFAAVAGTIAAVQLAAPVRALTQGGPRGATDLAAFHLYQEAFTYFDWGRVSAMAVILVVLLLATTAALLRLLRARWEY